MPGTALAVGTKMAASPGDDNTPDGGLAARAGFTFFLINAQPLMKVAWTAFDVNIIAKSRSLKINGALENFLHRAVKAVCGSGRNALRLGERMNAGFKQRLVRIDVTQA